MPTINLLPWREELRQKRKKEFLIMAFGAVLMAAALSFGTRIFYDHKITNQDARNALLRSEISALDKQIAEINELDSRKRRLLDRMEIIDELERATPETVTLVDSLVDIIPEGTYLTAVRQQGTRIELDGRAQSNQRVSDLMRNVEASEWLKKPDLGPVVTRGEGPQKQSEFELGVTQIRISDLEEE